MRIQGKRGQWGRCTPLVLLPRKVAFWFP
jgi:hypothetical protein